MKPAATYIAAPPGEVYWRYERCPNPGAKVLLLTVHGVCVIGQWNGELNQHYRAWCPLPKERPRPV